MLNIGYNTKSSVIRVADLETLEDDAPLLLKMAGIDDRVSFPPIYESTGSGEVLEYYSQVPPRYIRQLGEQYRNDFEMFGYEYLGSVKKLLNQSFFNSPQSILDPLKA